MHIYLKIVGETREPLKREFHGNYAIEIMIIRITEIYFGREISTKIEGVLKTGDIKL